MICAALSGGMEINVEHNTHKHPLNGKKIALFVLYAFIAVCLLLTVLSFNDLPSIMEQMKSVNMNYTMLAILMVLTYMATYPISLCILAKAEGCRAKTSMTYTIAMTEHFFNGITPLATGGQPLQAHSYTRAKVKISESTGLLLTNLIIYMMVTTAYSLTGLFFLDTLLASIDHWWIPIIIIGYSLNFMMMVIMILLGTSKGVRALLMKGVFFLCRFNLFKKMREKTDDISLYFEQVQAAFNKMIHRKWHFLLAILAKIVSFAFLYGSTYFVLLSMNVSVTPSMFFLVLSGTSFAVTAVGFIPTPGASGGVEGSAAQIFKSIIIFAAGGAPIIAADATANGVMLIWRLISYYLVMAISLAFYIGLEIYFIKKGKKQK